MQVTTTQTDMVQTPAPAVAPPPATGSQPTVTFTGVDGVTQTLQVPMSRQEIANLRARRTELSNQLNSASGRRKDLANQLKTASGTARTGLEQRVQVLDERIVQLESDMAATGRQLSNAPSLKGTEIQPGDIPKNVMVLGLASTFFIGFPLAIALARLLWKRGSRVAAAPAQMNEATSQRLERLEQGVDAIAIEIERVSEGQRFVTRLLSEGQSPLQIGQLAGEKVSASRD
jgi:hypothetical protein